MGLKSLCLQQPIFDLPFLKLADCKSGNQWDADFFIRLVGHRKAEEIIEQLGCVELGNDKLIRLPQPTSLFSTKSAWNCIRLKGQDFFWA